MGQTDNTNPLCMRTYQQLLCSTKAETGQTFLHAILQLSSVTAHLERVHEGQNQKGADVGIGTGGSVVGGRDQSAPKASG